VAAFAKAAALQAGGPADITMKWFPLRKPSGESLPVSMAGIKLGDRLLVVGCADPILIARLAVKTGLTGRAFAVDEQEKAVTAAEEIATREGALIETAKAPWTTLPLEPDSFDVAIVRDVLPHLTKDARSGCISEVLRVLRPGGRCLVIDGRERTGIVAAVRGAPASSDYGAPGGPVHGLTTQGFKAARILAEREGLLFAEAIKANPQSSNH
jgi:ubiquinone/menaquinone biosynthesis C-methylase UbiE